MLNPRAIVLLVDQDGDAFPIVVWGNRTDEEATAEALRSAAAYIAEGDMRPNGELTVKSIQRV